MKHVNPNTNLFFRKTYCTIFKTLLFFFTFNTSYSQEAILSSGTDIFNANGTLNYSVGQVVQNLNSGINGSIIQGIQFYFDSSTLNIINLDNKKDVFAFPNPVTSTLTIRTKENQYNSLSYELYSITGEVIKKGEIKNSLSKIDFTYLQAASYFFKIIDRQNNKTKTFKIIKK